MLDAYFGIMVGITFFSLAVALIAGALHRSDNDGWGDHRRKQGEARFSILLIAAGLLSPIWPLWIPIAVVFYAYKFVRYATGGLLYDAGYTSPWKLNKKGSR